jgi:NAD(P)-dependent dehydrogenase (short-subunit alcohol dehydrogenase family)
MEGGGTMTEGFEGRVAIVTGAASGIGRASALAFARAGTRVVVADLDEAGGEETVRLVAAAGGEATFVRTDVSRSDSVAALVRAAVDRWGRLDFAHNNAGVNDAPSPLAEIDDARWARMIGVHLNGVFYCLREELHVMAARGSGAIVNTSSGAGVFAAPRIAPYAAAKHGIIGLTRTAALDYADRGIRVNAVCPGLVDTPMHARTLAFNPEWAQRSIEFSRGRINKPEQVADTVLWLCGPEAAGVTGQALLVDGRYGAEKRLATNQHWSPLDELVKG